MKSNRLGGHHPCVFRFLSGAVAAMTALLCILWISPVAAQNPDYQLTITNTSGDTGDVVGVETLLDSTGAPISGWSYGVCHDQSGLELVTALSGSTTAIVNNGTPAEFQSVDLFAGGFTIGAVICFTGCATLGTGMDFQLSTSTYEITGLAPTAPAIELCDTLGSPPVPVIMILSGGLSESTVETDGFVQILGPPPRFFRYTAEPASAIYDPGDGLASLEAALSIVELPTNPTFPNAISGFTMSVRYEPGFLVALQVDLGSDLSALQGGMGPDFFAPQITADAITIEALTGPTPMAQLLANGSKEVARIQFDTNPVNLTFNPFGVTTPLTWEDGLGSPALDNVIDSPGLLTGLSFQDGPIELIAVEKFLRGDANDDGSIDIGDALRILSVLFNNNPVVCEPTTDTNASGSTDIADAVTLLDFLFNMGADLPAPFMDCGFDPTPSGNCPSFASCP